MTSPNVSPPVSSLLLVRISTSQAKSPMTQSGAVTPGTVAVDALVHDSRMVRT